MQSTLPNIVTGKIKELIEKSSNLCEIHLKMLNSNGKDSIHNINEELIYVSALIFLNNHKIFYSLLKPKLIIIANSTQSNYK